MLSLKDIFSFDVLGNEAKRYNFEELFHKYESDIKTDTESLISKLPSPGADIKSEICNLFISKFLNFVRNPYSIQKMLNTFVPLKNIFPTDPMHSKNFRRVIDGTKPHQQDFCDQLGVTEDEYVDWLAAIFLLLTDIEGKQTNFLEQAVMSLFSNKNRYCQAIIYTFDNGTCLLSDRGYSISSSEKDCCAFDFNLCSNAFIRYIFTDIDKFFPSDVSKNIIEISKTHKSIDVRHIPNDPKTLADYNKQVVYQCYKNVFNSSTYCYGLTLLS